MRRLILRPQSLICLVLLLGGCREIFPFPSPEPGSTQDASNDWSSSPIDGAAPGDLLLGDSQPQRDGPAPPRRLSCEAPKLLDLLGPGDTVDLHEPAISPDGLELWINPQNKDYWHKSTRADHVSSWGLAVEQPTLLTTYNDLAFYKDEQTMHALVVQYGPDSSARAIYRCDDFRVQGCTNPEEVIFKDQTGMTLAPFKGDTDYDGPAVVNHDGQRLLLFNITRFDDIPLIDAAKIYLAPVDLASWQWTAQEVPSLVTDKTHGQDDPSAISVDDALLIVFIETGDTESPRRLFYSVRPTGASSFQTPEPVPYQDMNQDIDQYLHNDALLYLTPPLDGLNEDQIELYFVRAAAPGANAAIYQVLCALK